MNNQFSEIEMFSDELNSMKVSWANIIRRTRVYCDVMKAYRYYAFYLKDESLRRKFLIERNALKTSMNDRHEKFLSSLKSSVCLEERYKDYVDAMTKLKTFEDASRKREDDDDKCVLQIFCIYAKYLRSGETEKFFGFNEYYKNCNARLTRPFENLPKLLSIIHFHMLCKSYPRMYVRILEKRIPFRDILENMKSVR